jgi:hypothetical protein
MKIYRYNESNYAEAARILAEEGVVGFDVFPSRAQEVFDQTLHELANLGKSLEHVVKDCSIIEDGYVYVLRDQNMVDDATCGILTKLEYARMFAN